MDLEIIQNALRINSYRSCEMFEADMRLMFRNCYEFYRPHEYVYQLRQLVEREFERFCSERPKTKSQQLNVTASRNNPQTEIERNADIYLRPDTDQVNVIVHRTTALDQPAPSSASQDPNTSSSIRQPYILLSGPNFVLCGRMMPATFYYGSLCLCEMLIGSL
jgi:hypothetical protein